MTKTTQQHDCYAAEARLDRGRVFDSVAAVQAFVDSLRDTAWWHGQGYHLHVPRIEVGAARKNAKASVGWFDFAMGGGRIELTPSGLCMKTVLHEVAHVISAAAYGSKAHDPWWARTYLTLVSCVMGAEVYLSLQVAFDDNAVDYTVEVTPSHVIAL